MLPLGGAIFSFLMGWIRKLIGTRQILIISSFVLILGWILITWAQNLWMLLIGRFLTGFTAATVSNVIPLYIGEIASTEIRGILLLTFQLTLSLGTTFVFIVSYFWSLFVINLIFIGIAFINLIAYVSIPESPIFLVSIESVDMLVSFILFN